MTNSETPILDGEGTYIVNPPRPNPDMFFDNKTFLPNRLATTILRHRILATYKDSKVTIVYDNRLGIYTPDGDTNVEQLADHFLGARSRPGRIKQTLSLLKVRTYVDRELFTPPPNHLVVENGVINLDTGKLHAHSPDWKAINRLPMNYDPEATCPGFERFTEQVVYPKDRITLQEFFGYCLIPGYPYHKALMLIGDGSNGKTTYVRLVTRFLGIQNVSSIPLQDLQYKFLRAELYGKLANIGDDLSSKDLSDSGWFKKLTGESPVTAERKHQPPFGYVNGAKMLYTANEVPLSKDKTRAFYRRWIPVRFPYTFVGKQSDPHLLDKLTTPQELSGILNLAIEGRMRLIRQGGFTVDSDYETVRRQYEEASDSVARFTSSRLAFESDLVTPKKALYRVYECYCEENGLPQIHYGQFCQRIGRIKGVKPSKQSEGGKPSKQSEGGKRVNCFAGVGLAG